MMRPHLFSLLLLAAFVAGCGSDSSSSSTTQGTPVNQPELPMAGTYTFTGLCEYGDGVLVIEQRQDGPHGLALAGNSAGEPLAFADRLRLTEVNEGDQGELTGRYRLGQQAYTPSADPLPRSGRFTFDGDSEILHLSTPCSGDEEVDTTALTAVDERAPWQSYARAIHEGHDLALQALRDEAASLTEALEQGRLSELAYAEAMAEALEDHSQTLFLSFADAAHENHPGPGARQGIMFAHESVVMRMLEASGSTFVANMTADAAVADAVAALDGDAEARWEEAVATLQGYFEHLAEANDLSVQTLEGAYEFDAVCDAGPGFAGMGEADDAHIFIIVDQHNKALSIHGHVDLYGGKARLDGTIRSHLHWEHVHYNGETAPVPTPGLLDYRPADESFVASTDCSGGERVERSRYSSIEDEQIDEESYTDFLVDAAALLNAGHVKLQNEYDYHARAHRNGILTDSEFRDALAEAIAFAHRRQRGGGSLTWYTTLKDDLRNAIINNDPGEPERSNGEISYTEAAERMLTAIQNSFRDNVLSHDYVEAFLFENPASYTGALHDSADSVSASLDAVLLELRADLFGFDQQRLEGPYERIELAAAETSSAGFCGNEQTLFYLDPDNTRLFASSITESTGHVSALDQIELGEPEAIAWPAGAFGETRDDDALLAIPYTANHLVREDSAGMMAPQGTIYYDMEADSLHASTTCSSDDVDLSRYMVADEQIPSNTSFADYLMDLMLAYDDALFDLTYKIEELEYELGNDLINDRKYMHDLIVEIDGLGQVMRDALSDLHDTHEPTDQGDDTGVLSFDQIAGPGGSARMSIDSSTLRTVDREAGLLEEVLAKNDAFADFWNLSRSRLLRSVVLDQMAYTCEPNTTLVHAGDGSSQGSGMERALFTDSFFSHYPGQTTFESPLSPLRLPDNYIVRFEASPEDDDGEPMRQSYAYTPSLDDGIVVDELEAKTPFAFHLGSSGLSSSPVDFTEYTEDILNTPDDPEVGQQALAYGVIVYFFDDNDEVIDAFVVARAPGGTGFPAPQDSGEFFPSQVFTGWLLEQDSAFDTRGLYPGALNSDLEIAIDPENERMAVTSALGETVDVPATPDLGFPQGTRTIVPGSFGSWRIPDESHMEYLPNYNYSFDDIRKTHLNSSQVNDALANICPRTWVLPEQESPTL